MKSGITKIVEFVSNRRLIFFVKNMIKRGDKSRYTKAKLIPPYRKKIMPFKTMIKNTKPIVNFKAMLFPNI